MVVIDNGRLLLMDSEGEIRSVQHLDQGGTPITSLRDAQGTIRSRLRLTEDGTPAVELFNAEGEQVWSAPCPRRGR